MRHRQLQGILVEDQGQGTLAEGRNVREESESVEGGSDTLHLDVVVVEGQATRGPAEQFDRQRRDAGLVGRAKVVEHLDGVSVERTKVAVGGDLAYERPEVVGGQQQRSNVAEEREEVDQVVGLVVELDRAARQEVAVSRCFAQGTDRRRFTRCSTLAVA